MKKYILFVTLSLITMNVLAKSDKDYCHLPDSKAM